LEVRADVSPAFAEILTPDASVFLARLADRFEAERQRLLAARKERQRWISEGALPDFLDETREVRTSTWSAAPIPRDLLDRRVEITGPPERKMLINALNSGASVYMSDFEDSNAPTWRNLIEGQINLRDAVRRQIEYSGPDGKQYVAVLSGVGGWSGAIVAGFATSLLLVALGFALWPFRGTANDNLRGT